MDETSIDLIRIFSEWMHINAVCPPYNEKIIVYGKNNHKVWCTEIDLLGEEDKIVDALDPAQEEILYWTPLPEPPNFEKKTKDII